jgi:hypothetical protein
MTDAYREPDVDPDVMEEGSLDEPPLPDDVDEADALDQHRGVTGGVDEVAPSIADGVDEADAIDQATPVGFDDDDDWREG